jgi:uncharacterized protein YbjT (DUF2867 family)
MIVITGATGALNGAAVEHLLKLVPADQIGVSVRDAAKAQHLAERGVRVRRGSYEDPAVLLDSFEGADQVLLVSSNDPGADGVSLHRVGIETAVAAGARRILYTSHQHTGLDSPFFPARHHAATEALLADSGVAWTSLRNGFYAHSLDWLLGPWRETGRADPAPSRDGPPAQNSLAGTASRAFKTEKLLSRYLHRSPELANIDLAESRVRSMIGADPAIGTATIWQRVRLLEYGDHPMIELGDLWVRVLAGTRRITSGSYGHSRTPMSRRSTRSWAS